MEASREPEAKWTRLGYCTVDSGALGLLDLCYEELGFLDGWSEAIGDQSYIQLGDEVKSGVVVTTYGGDGRYPVYGKMDADGSVLRVVVEFFNAGDGLDERRRALREDGLVLDRRDPGLPFVSPQKTGDTPNVITPPDVPNGAGGGR